MAVPEPIRLLLLARHPVVCAGLRDLLRQHDAVTVVAEASTVSDAISLAPRARPDVVILDPDHADITMSAVERIGKACSGRILVFTAAGDPEMCVRAIEHGAAGVVSKAQPTTLLVRAIEKIHCGELWLDRAQTATVLSRVLHHEQDPERAKIESLTPRERQIVAKVGEGLKNCAIAEQLFISEATVRNHLTSILAKLELRGRFELAVYAFRHGLVETPEAEPSAAKAQ